MVGRDRPGGECTCFDSTAETERKDGDEGGSGKIEIRRAKRHSSKPELAGEMACPQMINAKFQVYIKLGMERREITFQKNCKNRQEN